MVITMVIDLFGDPNNGSTVTAIRTAQQLHKLGHEIRIVAWIPDKVKDEDYPDFKLLRCPKITLPIFDPLVTANGFTFAKAEEKKIAEFIRGSDVVHLMFPFALEAKVRKIAKVMGIPVTSAYHLQPDSISYNIHLGKVQLVNSFIYRLFYNCLYKFTRTVHTPSANMKRLMLKHHYKNDIYPISNGVSPRFTPAPEGKPEEWKDRFVILMIGRLSGEKRQDLIIKAIGKSKYNDKIQLVLLGKGPQRKKLEKLAKKNLINPVVFKFASQDEVLKIIRMSDLYVHCSDIESEAIAAIEAFSCGIVPVISDSKYSATNQFALDPLCLFKAGKPESLTEKIEYFMEHPEEKTALSVRYAEYGKEFEISQKAKALEEMMKLEIERDQEDKKNNRTYYSTASERRKLKKLAKRLNIENPCIYKDDIYHAKKKD